MDDFCVLLVFARAELTCDHSNEPSEVIFDQCTRCSKRDDPRRAAIADSVDSTFKPHKEALSGVRDSRHSLG